MFIYLLFFASLFLAICYAFLIMKYLDGWKNTSSTSNIDREFTTSVSIVIAAFNEEEQIEDCVRSILSCDYPTDLMELIVVDNDSTDKTLDVLRQIKDSRLKIAVQKEGNKKEAIEKGISLAANKFLLFTDADCTVQKEWIKSMIHYHEIQDADCILGPIQIKSYNNLLTRFQAFDMLAMMGITCGGLKQDINYLSNGGNFGYTQKLYYSIQEIPRKDYASGDDVMTLHAFVKLGKVKIVFQKDKDAIVSTLAQRNWKGLIQQRIRWASKATSYVRKKDIYINAFIFLLVLSIALNIILIPFTGGLSLFICLFQLMIKGAIDYAFLDHVNQFFKRKHLMRYFISSFLVYNVYILFSGFTSMLGLSYMWKGKRLK